jgi:hypothetical protein
MVGQTTISTSFRKGSQSSGLQPLVELNIRKLFVIPNHWSNIATARRSLAGDANSFHMQGNSQCLFEETHCPHDRSNNFSLPHTQ